MYSNILTKLFLSRRAFVILIVLSLASASLLSSSLIIASYTINTVLAKEISRLPYHLIIYTYSTNQYRDSRELNMNLTNIISRSNLINNSVSILVETRIVKKIVVGNTTINNSRVNLMLVPELNDTIIFPYGKIREKIISSNIPKLDLKVKVNIGNTSFETSIAYREEELKHYLNIAFIKAFDKPYIATYEGSVNPYIYVFDKLRMGIREDYNGLFVLTGSSEVFNSIINEVGINDSIAKLTLDDIYYIGEQSYSSKVEIHGSTVLVILNLNAEELSRGYGATHTINKVFELLNYLENSVKPLELNLLDDWVIIKLINIKQGDQQFRLAIGITLLPIMFIVWIILSKTPEFLISVHKREIALLKIRGVSTKLVFKGFLQSVLIYTTIGTTIGLFISPILPSLILRKTIDFETYIRDFYLITDPFMLVLVFGLTYVLCIGHLINGLKEISRIEPLEFIRTSYSTTQFERLTTSFYVLIALTIYITLRYTILNPFKLLYSSQYSLVAQVISVILLVLEPVTTLFGPVIVVYTLSKLLTSYPQISYKLIEGVSKVFTKKYHGLIAKFSRTKLNYLALAMITSYFSLSLLFGSIIAIDLTKNIYERSGIAMHGGYDFILYKPISISNYTDLVREMENVSSMLSNSSVKYSSGLLILGYTPFKGENIEYHSSLAIQVEGKDIPLYKTIYLSVPGYNIPISYILFIDNNFITLSKVVEELSYTGKFGDSLNQLVETPFSSIYVFNTRGEAIVKKQYLNNKPYVGNAEIKFGSHTLINTQVLASARNIPLSTALVRAGLRGLPIFQTELPYSGLASFPISVPTERGLIMRYDDFKTIISETRKHGYKGSYFGYILVFCKGYASITGSTEFKSYYLDVIKTDIDKFVDTMCLSHKFTLFTSICLYVASQLVLSILAYAIVFENMRSNALMIGRGVSIEDVYKLCVFETLSLLIICLVPGIVAGFMIGYGLSRISMQIFELVEVTPIFIDEAFGVTTVFVIPLPAIIATLVAIIVPLTLALIITSTSWKKTLKESIKVLTGV